MTTTMGSLDLSALNNLYDETQYFWFESSAQPWGAGAHVTLYPQSEFTTSTHDNYLKGQNILMNTDGFSLRNGTLPMMTLDNNSLDFNVIDTTNQNYTNVASFGSVSTIGVTDNTQSYLQLDYHSFQMIDKEDDPYLRVADLRDANGVAQVIDVFTADGVGWTYVLSVVATDTNYTVEVSNTSGGTITKYLQSVQFSSVPTAGTVITVTYNTASQYAKEYTFGVRANNNAPHAPMSFASGLGTTASAFVATAEGYNTTASGKVSHAEGYHTTASGYYSHAEGDYTIASGGGSHAEGTYTTASGYYSHAEGTYTTASGGDSHAEGTYTTASGVDSHAEGYHTTASGNVAHAEGYYTTARGVAHAEGQGTIASESGSHAEGYYTIAGGTYSHVQNLGTVATQNAQTVMGKYNSATVNGSGTTTDPYTYTDVGDYAFIIGNGTANTTANRSNAFTVDWSGNVIAAGAITATGLPSGLTTEQHSNSTGSISATTDSGSKSITATKSGYYPLGVVGWNFTGTNYMYQNLYYCRISSASNGSATVSYRFRNNSSVAYSGTFNVDILWVKI